MFYHTVNANKYLVTNIRSLFIRHILKTDTLLKYHNLNFSDIVYQMTQNLRFKLKKNVYIFISAHDLFLQ
jgi:hypothetical protein